MTVTAYETPDGAPESITGPVDTLTCDLRICCERGRPASVGWQLVEDPDTGRGGVVWSPTFALTVGDDPPVLSCEDCLCWLQDVFAIPTTPEVTA